MARLRADPAGPGLRRAGRPDRELDSLADMISFGVAPAIIAYGCGMQGRYDRIVPCSSSPVA